MGLNTRLSQGASASTINREKGTLSKLFQTMIELQLVEANPVRLVKNLSQKSEERQVYLSFADVQKILSYCPGWFRATALTSYYFGARRGELLGLTRKQVNLSHRMIYLGPEDTKEGHWKRVPIHLDLVPVLEECLRVTTLTTDKVFLIRDRRGIRPPSVSSMKNPWQRAMNKLDFQTRPRFHDLRHTWRANARRSGIDPDIAEAILGHWNKGRAVNQRYGWISDEELIRAVDSMKFDCGETQVWVAGK